MTLGIFQRILAALSRIGMTPTELVERLEFMAAFNEKEGMEQ